MRELRQWRSRLAEDLVADAPPLGQKREGVVLGEDARAVLDYRVAVETGATVLAAERATEGDLANLEERRIASGSGVHVSEVNKLLKNYLQMQKVMKSMTKAGGISAFM